MQIWLNRIIKNENKYAANTKNPNFLKLILSTILYAPKEKTALRMWFIKYTTPNSNTGTCADFIKGWKFQTKRLVIPVKILQYSISQLIFELETVSFAVFRIVLIWFTKQNYKIINN